MRDGQPGSNDPSRPPDIPTEVHCLHCDQEYESYLIRWVPHDDNNPMEGFWCCPTPGCDGKGFGFDIFPTDPDWRDENGDKLWEEFDDEEELEAYEEEEGTENFDEAEDEEFEWTPEWEQAAYGEREEEDSESDEAPGDGEGKKPPEEPLDEDELPW